MKISEVLEINILKGVRTENKKDNRKEWQKTDKYDKLYSTLREHVLSYGSVHFLSCSGFKPVHTIHTQGTFYQNPRLWKRAAI